MKAWSLLLLSSLIIVVVASASTSDNGNPPPSQSPWSDWSNQNPLAGAIVLKNIRDNLLKNNLHDPHVSYGGYGQHIDCSKRDIRFRSADGTCTNLQKPLVGAAGVAFGRNIDPKFIDQNAIPKLMSPNPGLVSREMFTRDEFKPVPFLNLLASNWIQFMTHDWVSHGKNREEEPYRIDGVDPSIAIVEKTAANPIDPSSFNPKFGRKVTLNHTTHWWDGSQLYGNDQEQQNTLRSFKLGKMKTVRVNGRELLPKDPSFDPKRNKQNFGLEMAGVRDNWSVGLSMFHTLFVKEHNAIAEQLFRKHVTYNPSTDKYTWKNGRETRVLNEAEIDEQVFQTARLINAAVMAKIHTIEWTPAILPNMIVKKALFTNWYGLANPQTWSSLLKNLPALKKTDWFEEIDTDYLIGGIVGNATKDYGVPYSMTEEFTSVYRLHPLIPDKVYLKKEKDRSQGPVQVVSFNEMRSDKSYGIMASNDLTDLFYSWGTQNPGQIVLNNYPRFMQQLTLPGFGKIDLGMVDVIRDRERGVPRYNQFRRALSLKPVGKFSDFFPAGKPLDERQEAILKKMVDIYGKDANGNDNVETIDLLVGTLAEEVRPQGFGFGETLFQIFILMASRRLMVDRFFTEYYKDDYYTKTGMKWIDEEGFLHKVLSRHMPELKKHMEGLESAFLPWNP